MEEFRLRVEVLTEQLQTSAGIDPRMDIFNSGYICAAKDLLNIELEKE